MRVLLIVADLYHDIGGGQTVYKKIIDSAPETEFTYFTRFEKTNTQRPNNVRVVPLDPATRITVDSSPTFPAYRHYALTKANAFARSVAGQHFDIVDVPDFVCFGNFLRDAFAHHNVSVGRFVLAMHGNISKSIEMQWGSCGDNALEQRILEQEQFEKADYVYSISPSYIKEWQSIVPRSVHYIDPIHFIEKSGLFPKASSAKPNLYCIGRGERRKGIDLFVELSRWIDRDAYDKAIHIGDEDYSNQNVCSTYLLHNIATARGTEYRHESSMNRAGLHRIFAENSLIVLPVRYDTLNFVALEALFAGCPVAVSSKAGVCDYLDRTFPSLPYIKIDFDHFYNAANLIETALRDYPAYRKKLSDALESVLYANTPQLDFSQVYAAANDAPARMASDQKTVYAEKGLSTRSVLGGLVRAALPNRTYKLMLSLPFSRISHIRHYLRHAVRGHVYDIAALFVKTLRVRRIPGRLRYLRAMPESSRDKVREKLDTIYGLCDNPLYRCNYWLEIARLERLLGNDVMAATYEIRVLRLMGSDEFGLLPGLLDTLQHKGFGEVAAALHAQFSNPNKAEENVYNYLHDAYRRNMTKSFTPFERVVDRRQGTARVAVIVSLYNAASKLSFFLTALSQQTLIKSGQVEIILIDSGSPTDEYAILDQFWNTTPLNAVYARSSQRETIQAAWNRGINLSQAPYLVFLGVDETLYPEALYTLAQTLDENPSTDWVMSNSLVTEVDAQGVLKNDVMSYIRDGATKDHVYLETCYLSWVGGMYRKSIHERFGYYDETFGAAGDTEVKNRILPFINVKFIPQTLGLFLNYPDERTTASPRAEIEDFRAWYIHRTPGGVRYAFENRPHEDAEKLLLHALGYRKSFCAHTSTDAEYASAIANYLEVRDMKRSWLPSIATDLQTMLKRLRVLEMTNKLPGSFSCLNDIYSTVRAFSKLEKRHRSLLPSQNQATYSLFNDNRYEQHSWLWKSTTSK